MAGVLGIEPRNAEIKTRCLTAWLHPNKYRRNKGAILLRKQQSVNENLDLPLVDDNFYPDVFGLQSQLGRQVHLIDSTIA